MNHKKFTDCEFTICESDLRGTTTDRTKIFIYFFDRTKNFAKFFYIILGLLFFFNKTNFHLIFGTPLSMCYHYIPN